MKVSPVHKQYNPLLTAKNTGYFAATSLGTCVLSGISKNKNIKALHKPAAYFAVFFTAMHIGILQAYKNKYKRM